MQREAWIQQLRDQTPFASNRVSSSLDAQVHVDSIHRAAYDQLLALAQEARNRPRGGCGVVLWGDPGVGKSHLLARFATSIQADEQGLFLLIHNLLVAPRFLPSSLLKCFIARLTARGVSHPAKTPLYGLLYKLIVRTVQDDKGCLPETIPPQRAKELFVRHVLRTIQPLLPEQCGPDCRRIAEVLFAYFQASYRVHRNSGEQSRRARHRSELAAAIQWLGGEELETPQWELLGLSPTAAADTEVLEPNDQLLETILLVLLEIARQAGTLVVLCFDQVENLSPDRFIELFRFNHALLDHGRNLLMITSGVKADLVSLRKQALAPEAAWDRIAAEEIALPFITVPEAKKLLQARMQPLSELFGALPEVAELARQDDLFPLGQAWWESGVAGQIDARPRGVISWAHQRWREQCRKMTDDWDSFVRDASHGAPVTITPAPSPTPTSLPPTSLPPPPDQARWVDERIECKVREKTRDFLHDPSRLPPDSEQLAGLLKVTLQRLGRSHGFQFVDTSRPRGGRPTYDLLVERRDGERRITVGIVVLPNARAASTTAAYRRVAQDTAPPRAVLVLRDARIEANLGERGREYQQQVRDRHGAGFQTFDLELGEYALLSALESVIGDARSGDLEVDFAGSGLLRIGEDEVEQSHVSRGRYSGSRFIQVLLELLASSDSTPTPARTSNPAFEDVSGDGTGDSSRRGSTETSSATDLRAYILGELQLVPGISSRELAERLHRQGPADPSVTLNELTRRLQDAAQQLHREQRLQATPTEDDLYLLLRP